MDKRIFPPADFEKTDQLAKGKSRYAQSDSRRRQVITPSRVAKRIGRSKNQK